MCKYFLLLALLITVIVAKAQNHGSVKATLVDSVTKQPVLLATVSILRQKDSALMSYTTTDKNGEFILRNLKIELSRLLISRVGYQSIKIAIDYKKGPAVDLGKLYLSAKTLQEVVVKGERIPIMIKKDTIEFDAEAFKTRPNALVEDLLRKLPGLQVNYDGTISVNGKDVSKIRVNGKDFFISDKKIALRELQANLVSKVQVYDDRENDPDHLVPDYQVKKIINLKFKKNFAKGVLSTLAVGAGNNDRYAASGFAAKFQDDLQLSAKLGSDNLSNTGFFSGNYGGFSNMNLGYTNTPLSKQTDGNFDFTEDITKKMKLHIEYRFNNRVTDNNTDTKTQQNISDTIITSLSEMLSHVHINNQTLHAEAEWKPDSLTIIKYNPNMDYSYTANMENGTSTNSNTYLPKLNNSLSSSNNTDHSFQYAHNISYYHKLNKKGMSITVGNSIGIHPGTSNSLTNNELISFITAYPSDTLNRSAKNVTNDVNQGINANYHYPITKKLWLDVNLIGLHDRNSGNLVTYQQDLKTGLYNIYLADQSSNLVRNLWGESLMPQLTYNFTDNIYIKAGITGLAQQIGNHFNSYTNDLDQNFFYFLPSGEVHVKSFTLGYSQSVQQPSINSLQPITIVYSPLYTFIGNPYLKPTYFHNLNFNFRKYNFQKHVNLNFNAGLVIERNSVVNEQTVNAEGATVTSPINRNGRVTGYWNGSFIKNIKKDKWDFTLLANIGGSAEHNFFIVNGRQGYQNTQTINFGPQFTVDWNNLINIGPTYYINYATTQYTQVNYPSNSYTTQVAGMWLDLSIPKDFRWRIDYKHAYNPMVPPGFQHNSNLLNFQVTKSIQKNKGEIGLVGYDMLNQAVGLQHYVSGNAITDIQNQVLKRYVLLTYTYHFNKFK